jgi:hypothetical protein
VVFSLVLALSNTILDFRFWIIENRKISFSQAQLNVAKQALLPLAEQSRFEMRYVYPNR